MSRRDPKMKNRLPPFVEGLSPRRKLKGLKWQSGAKRLSDGLATRPSERPPDPENGSPGTVDTAAGAEVQTNVLQRTTLKYRKSHSAVQSSAVYDESALVGIDETDIIGSGLIDIIVTGQTAKRLRCEVSLRLVGVS